MKQKKTFRNREEKEKGNDAFARADESKNTGNQLSSTPKVVQNCVPQSGTSSPDSPSVGKGYTDDSHFWRGIGQIEGYNDAIEDVEKLIERYETCDGVLDGQHWKDGKVWVSQFKKVIEQLKKKGWG